MPNCLRRRRGAVLYARSQRPLRASPSLSHSADGGEGARGANFDVKLHHNNGSQHVQLRGGGGGGGGGSWAITERGLPRERRNGGAGPLFVCHTVQFLLRLCPLFSSSFGAFSPLTIMPLPGADTPGETGCVGRDLMISTKRNC